MRIDVINGKRTATATSLWDVVFSPAVDHRPQRPRSG
jgi:hypothetical protein